MELELAGKRAVVGGATSGLGRAIADALAAEGCRLLIWSRSADRLAAAAEDLRARGVQVHTVAADASDPTAADMVAKAATGALGGVDVLILNAGGPPVVDPIETTPEGWATAFQLLAITPITLATALLPGMREQGWGRIVAVLSSGIKQPIPELVYSNAGRVALAAWMKTAAGKLAADGITLNGVVPGRLSTERARSLDQRQADRTGKSVEEVERDAAATIPIRRYGQPRELAALVAFLASGPASYLTGTFTGVDGGSIRSLF